MKRVILHCDINHFYAGVEALFEPQYRHVPMAVGGDQERRHGIILAKNPHAKKYGVQTGEPLWQARQKCPNLIIVPARFSLYLRFSQMVFAIYSRYTDRIEPFGIDEAWLDVSDATLLYSSPMAIAKAIANDVYQECGLTLSIGISFNKVFAKLGSDYKKPNGITLIEPHHVSDVVFPLPVSDLLYVGRATTKKLSRYGIHTIGDLAHANQDFLIRHFGKIGSLLWHFANGQEYSAVTPSSHATLVKSVGNSVTTRMDMVTMDDIEVVATVLAESIASRLKGHGFSCRCISVSIRDDQLKSFTRQKILAYTTNISKEILQAAMELFKENIHFPMIIRSIGIKADQLQPANQPTQISLFIPFETRIKDHKVDETMDVIRKRFGFKSVIRASLLAKPLLSDFNPKGDHVIFPVSFFKPQ
jgi:DNA polymerase IV